jgi:nitrite reductase/ring-hydroxylating ferredoxin subunit
MEEKIKNILSPNPEAFSSIGVSISNLNKKIKKEKENIKIGNLEIHFIPHKETTEEWYFIKYKGKVVAVINNCPFFEKPLSILIQSQQIEPHIWGDPKWKNI